MHTTALESFLRSNTFALILSMLLMLTQSMHTSHALYDLTTLPSEWLKYVFAILTALFMDFLIVFFIAKGAIRESYIFFTFCALMNIYAYHISIDFLGSTQSYFSFVPAIGVPFAVHSVALQIRSEEKCDGTAKKKSLTHFPGAKTRLSGEMQKT